MEKLFLAGERIYLRALEKGDLTATYEQWLNDPLVCRFNSHHRFPNYEENMRVYFQEIINDRRHLVLAIIDRATESHIGNVALHNIDQLNQTAEFAILIGNKTSWGKGIGFEAGQLIIHHGFGALNLYRVYCGTSQANIPMQRLAKKMGFKKEGVSRQAFYKDGQRNDILLYGLLRDEYEKKKNHRRVS